MLAPVVSGLLPNQATLAVVVVVAAAAAATTTKMELFPSHVRVGLLEVGMVVVAAVETQAKELYRWQPGVQPPTSYCWETAARGCPSPRAESTVRRPIVAERQLSQSVSRRCLQESILLS